MTNTRSVARTCSITITCSKRSQKRPRIDTLPDTHIGLTQQAKPVSTVAWCCQLELAPV